jgi:hypothetical protein
LYENEEVCMRSSQANISLGTTLLLFLPLLVSAQVDTAWVRTFNGSANSGDWAHDIVVDDAGYVYITGGSSGSGTYNDYATIKYDPNGNTVWSRIYNGLGNGYDEGDVLAVDQLGNVYVTGYSDGSGAYYDCVTIKYLPNGDTVWVRRCDGPSTYWNEAFAIAIDNSGNICVACESEGYGTSSDYTTMKYYPNGDTAWLRRYNGPGNGSDVSRGLAIDGASNVYITGESQGLNGSADYLTIKYYANGDTAWVRRYNGPGNAFDRAHDIAVDSSGAVYITGGSQGFNTDLDYATIKYYPNGDVAWGGDV